MIRIFFLLVLSIITRTLAADDLSGLKEALNLPDHASDSEVKDAYALRLADPRTHGIIKDSLRTLYKRVYFTRTPTVEDQTYEFLFNELKNHGFLNAMDSMNIKIEHKMSSIFKNDIAFSGNDPALRSLLIFINYNLEDFLNSKPSKERILHFLESYKKTLRQLVNGEKGLSKPLILATTYFIENGYEPYPNVYAKFLQIAEILDSSRSLDSDTIEFCKLLRSPATEITMIDDLLTRGVDGVFFHKISFAVHHDLISLKDYLDRLNKEASRTVVPDVEWYKIARNIRKSPSFMEIRPQDYPHIDPKAFHACSSL